MNHEMMTVDFLFFADLPANGILLSIKTIQKLSLEFISEGVKGGNQSQKLKDYSITCKETPSHQIC